jgi:PAS domain S-box-containing protein
MESFALLATWLRSVINQARHGMLVYEAVRDKQGKIINFKIALANESAAETLGWPLPTLSGRHFLEVFPQARALLPAYEAVVRTGQPFRHEWEREHRHHPGKPTWYEVWATPLDDGLVISMVEVSGLRQAKQEAERHQRRTADQLRSVFDASPWAIAFLEPIHDERGTVSDLLFALANPRATQMGAYTADQLLGGRLLDLYPHVRTTGLFEEFKWVLKSGKSFQTEMFYDWDGLHGWFHVNAVRQGTGLVVTVADITARKRAELGLEEETRRFREAQTLGRVGSFEWNKGDELTRWSDELYRLLGLEPQAIPITLEMTNRWVHPDDFPGLYTLQERSIQTPGRYEHTHRIIRSDGKICWVHHRFESLADEIGQVVRVRGTVQDITQQRQAEQEVLRLKDELARRAEDKYRAVFESLAEGVSLLEVLFDEDDRAVDYRFVENNPAVEQMTGVSGSTGKTVRELFPTIDSELIQRAGEVVRTGQSVRFEHTVPALDRWFDVHEARVGGEGSRLVVAVFQDVTERKRREANVALLDEISRELARLSTPDEIRETVGTRIGEALYASDCLFGAVDEPRGEVTVHHGWPSDHLPSLEQTFRIEEVLSEASIRACRAGEPHVFHNGHSDQPPEYPSGAFVIVPFHRQGRWTAYVAVTRTEPRDWSAAEIALLQEISNRLFSRLERKQAEEALRQSEERLRLLIESAQDFSIFTTDSSGFITSWSEGARRLFGWTAEEAIGQHGEITFTPEDRAAGAPEQELVTARREGRAPDERYHLRKDGSRFYVSGVVSPIQDGGSRGFVKIARDMTEQMRAQQQLEELNENLERLVDERTADLRKNLTLLQQTEAVADMGSWAFTPATGRFEWSEGMYRLFGLETGTPISPETYLAYTIDADRAVAERIVAFLRQAPPVGDSLKEQFRIRTAEGEKTIRLKAVVQRNEAGEPERVLGVDLNVTEQVEAERRVRAAADQLQSLLNGVPAAIGILEAVRDGRGQLVDFKPALTNLPDLERTDFSAGEMLTRRLLTDSGDWGRNGLLDFYAATLQTGEPGYREITYRLNDQPHWYGIYVTRQVDDNGVVVTALDITDLKRLQLQYRHQATMLEGVLNGSANSLGVYDAVYDESGAIVDFRVRLFNRAALQLSGLRWADVDGRTLLEISPHSKEIGIFQAAVEVIKTGVEQIVTRDYPYLGKSFSIALSRFNTDGLIVGSVDITPLRQAQRQQEELVEELRRSNQSLERFAYVTSHDLQEPLRKIQSFGVMLHKRLDDRLEPAEADLLRRMQDAAVRMKTLIEELLTYARLNARKETFRWLDLNQLVREVLTDLESTIEEKAAHVELGTLPSLHGDAMQWRQLFQNLLSNALKFNRPDVTPHVWVEARTVRGGTLTDVPGLEPDRMYHEISVRDNGIGFDETHRERIFDLFQRLHGRAEYEGTGIGLAIVKKVVEQHQGTITAHGRPGEGATFCVFVPISEPERTEAN